MCFAPILADTRRVHGQMKMPRYGARAAKRLPLQRFAGLSLTCASTVLLIHNCCAMPIMFCTAQ